MTCGWTSIRVTTKTRARREALIERVSLVAAASHDGSRGYQRSSGTLYKDEVDSTLFSSVVPLRRWVYFGHFDQADVRINCLPSGTHGRMLVVNRGLVVVEHDEVVSLHCSLVERDIAGVGLKISVDAAPVAECLTENRFRHFVEFIQSGFYGRLEEALLQQEPATLRSWSGAALFTPDGTPSSELVWTLQQIIGPEIDRGEAHLSQMLETACDYLEATIRGFGLIDPLVRQKGVKEVLVNGHKEIYVEGRGGMLACDAVFPSRDVLERLVESLLARMDTRLDATQPVAQGVLGGRYRVHIVSEQICPGGPSLSIRCFPEHTFQLEDLIGPTGQKQGVAALLVDLVKKRRNLLVCGETSSGKTSFMEALSVHIPPHERVIVAEDVRELRLCNAHKVYLQTHQGFGTSVAEIDLRGLVKESLRMRPDRLVIGECRGGEALDLLQALNTGHEGSMTSIHGSSPLAALRRLETLSMFGNARVTRTTASALIASGIHVVIQMSRRRSGARQVKSICYLSQIETSQVGSAEYEIMSVFEEATE